MELYDKVRLVLQEVTNEGETITFDDLIKRVAEPGDCLNCLRSPVRKSVTKLVENNVITMGVVF